MNNELSAALTKAATILVNEMNSLLSDGTRPHEIKDNIFIGQATQTNDGAQIQITIDHPAAKAYEYGSGLHRMKGAPQKYPIYPKEKQALAFEWPIARNIFPEKLQYSKSGKIVLPYVMHPGVEPKQFIAPAIVKTRQEIRKVLGHGFKAAVMVGREKVTTITVK